MSIPLMGGDRDLWSILARFGDLDWTGYPGQHGSDSLQSIARRDLYLYQGIAWVDPVESGQTKKRDLSFDRSRGIA